MDGSAAGIVVFCAVVEAGSFTGAAERLALSKGAVSKAVNRLEASLGARLLHRTTRRQNLTEAGAAFYRRAATRPRGHLRVNAPTFFGAEILSRHIGEFRRRYPQITLEIVHANRFVDLVEERFDAALRISAPVDSSLVMRRLAEIPMVFCAAPTYLQRRGRFGIPEELRGHDCLIYTGSGQLHQWPVFSRNGQRIAVAVDGGLHTNDDHTLRQAAIDGCGIVRMLKLFLQDAIARGELVQLWPDDAAPAVTLAVVYPSRRELPRKIRAFVDYLVECRGQWQPATAPA